MEEKKEEIVANVNNENDVNVSTENVSQKPVKSGKPKKDHTLGIIFFSLLLMIAFVYYLPQISDYVEVFLHGEKSITKVGTVEDNKDTDAVVNDKFYKLTDKIIFNNLLFSDIKFDKVDNDNYLNINIKNSLNSGIDLNSINYYIEFYSADNVFLARTLLAASYNLSTGEAKNLQYLVPENATSASQVKIVKKDTVDYPEITLSNKNDEYDTLICTDNYNQITYMFKDNMLHKMSVTEKYLASEKKSTYDALLLEYKKLSGNYSKLSGVTVVYTEENDDFIFEYDIDLNTAKTNEINNKYVFAKNTLAKEVKFKMESMRYTCK